MTTYILRQGVNPLPPVYGTERIIPFKGTETALRFAVTAGALDPSIITGVREAYADKQVGKTDVASWANQKFWWLQTGVDSFEVFIDRTRDLTGGSVFDHLPEAPWANVPYRGAVYGPVLPASGNTVHLPVVARKWGAAISPTPTQSAFGEGPNASAARDEVPPACRPLIVFGGNIGPTNGFYVRPTSMRGRLIALKKHTAGVVAPIFAATAFQVWDVPGGWATTINNNNESNVYGGSAWRAALDSFAVEFGVAAGLEGDKTAAAYAAEAFSFWTHPGVEGAVPGVGYRMHGVHPNIDHFRVVNGRVVEVTYRTTGQSLAQFVYEQKAFVDAQYHVAMDSMRASLQNDVGTRTVRLKLYAEKIGPFDIYGAKQIVSALDQGASVGDINAYVTGGKRCDAWRTMGNAKKPTLILAYVESGKTGQALTFMPRRASGQLVPLAGVPESTYAVFEDPAAGYGFDANTQWADRSALEAALRAAHPLTEWVSAEEYGLGIGELPSLASDRADMPMVWWKSLGLTDFEGIMRLFATATLVPVKERTV